MKPYQTALLLAALLPLPAAAQVRINPAALAQLAGIAPARPAPESAPAPVAAPAPPARPAWHPSRRVIRGVKPAPVKPLPSPAAPVVAKPAAPPPQPMATPQALVVAFAPGSASLPAGTGAALKPFCEAHGVIGIDARAPANPGDPSLAMRLSLARALALRDALTSCGVASQNILPRALGSVPGKNEDEAIIGVQK